MTETREVPRSSTAKKKPRNPQTRDSMAAMLAAEGLDLGSGRTWERCTYVVERADALRAAGHTQEGDLVAAAMDVSKRGAYEIARLSDEAICALCAFATENEIPHLIWARKLIRNVVQEQQAERKPVTLSSVFDIVSRTHLTL